LKYYPVYTFLLIFCIFSSPGVSYAQTTVSKNLQAEKLYRSGAEKYEFSEDQGAIEDLITCLQLNPKHTSAKLLLGLCLTQIVTEHYNNKQYLEILPYLEKLVELYPNDPQILAMYDKTKKFADKLIGKKPEKTAVQPAPPPVQESFSEADQNAMMEEVLSQVKKMQSRFAAKIEKREENILLTLIKTNIITAAATISAIVIMIVIILLYFRKMEQRREIITMSSYEKLLDKLNPYLASPPTHPLRPGEFPKILNSMNPEGRIHGIEVIEAELVADNSKEMRDRLLENFLKDNDIKVKSKALQVLHKYNPAKAFDNIKKMSADADTNTRICAAEILGNITSKESISLLISMWKDPDEKVQREVLKSLSNIYEKNKSELSGDILTLFEKCFDEAKNNWVFF
jgi:tetratricopeptide (TPR) repeat protein